MKISFIGAGQMAEALIARLKGKIIASDVDGKRLKYLRGKYGVKIAKSNAEAFEAGDIVILAVKPQQMGGVLEEIRNSKIGNSKLVISIAAGIPSTYLRKRIPGHEIIRAMPNNPALVGEGITAIARGPRVTRYALRVTREIFGSVGEVVIVPEKLMDAVTGLSGSGPAYVYKMIEALAAGGVRAGLPKKIAAKLALRTVLGAAFTVEKTGKEPSDLCAMVASPGGTTIEGQRALDKRKFSRALIEAVAAAAKRSALLSKQWAL